MATDIGLIKSDYPWLLDCIYWIESVICPIFPTLHLNNSSIYFGDLPEDAKIYGDQKFIFTTKDPLFINDSNIDSVVLIRVFDGFEPLSNLYYRVNCERNLDTSALRFFANAICVLFEEINKNRFAEINEDACCILRTCFDKRISELYLTPDEYTMPRSVKARYEFATNLAFFDYTIGEPYRSKARTFMRTLLPFLETRTTETYEGQCRAFACLITNEKNTSQEKLLDFLRNEESYLFSDASHTWFVVNREGEIIDYSTPMATSDFQNVPLKAGLRRCIAEKVRKSHFQVANKSRICIFAPQQYQRFASCCSGETIGVMVVGDGRILVFKNKSLVLSKQRGKWKYYDQAAIVGFLLKSITRGAVPSSAARDLANQLYLSILDVSFLRTGGCIGILDEGVKLDNECFSEANLHMKTDDACVVNTIRKHVLSVESTGVKKDHILRFNEIDSVIRSEIISMDGATTVNRDGGLMSVGYILKHIVPVSGHGGRTAAAVMLGKNGLGIKISEDGGVVFFSRLSETTDCDDYERIKVF